MKAVIELFNRLIDADVELLQQINANGEEIQRIDEAYRFTLRGLFNTLSDNAVSYKEFRSQLYASTLNEDLGKKGYKIEVYHSSGKVDSSWYQLIRLDKPVSQELSAVPIN